MVLKTLVIDDEAAFLQSIEAMLSSRSDKLTIVGNARSVAEGINKIKDLQPDLVFLDIQMGDGTGFDLLNALDRRDFQLVFVTAYDQYAIEAFQFSAMDYLLKPVVSTDLWRVVDRAYANHEKTRMEAQISVLLDNIQNLSAERKKIVLKESDSVHVVRMDEILWCAAEGSYTSFHLTENRKIVVSYNLKEYEGILTNNGFFRAHRSYMVNLQKIARIDKKDGDLIYLEDGSTVPVSVRKKESLYEVLSRLA